MIFFAFDLSEIHDRDGRLAMKYIAVAAKNLRAAKRFMKQFYPGQWSLVSSKTLDKGAVTSHVNKETTP